MAVARVAGEPLDAYGAGLRSVGSTGCGVGGVGGFEATAFNAATPRALETRIFATLSTGTPQSMAATTGCLSHAQATAPTMAEAVTPVPS